MILACPNCIGNFFSYNFLLWLWTWIFHTVCRNATLNTSKSAALHTRPSALLAMKLLRSTTPLRTTAVMEVVPCNTPPRNKCPRRNVGRSPRRAAGRCPARAVGRFPSRAATRFLSKTADKRPRSRAPRLFPILNSLLQFISLVMVFKIFSCKTNRFF